MASHSFLYTSPVNLTLAYNCGICLHTSTKHVTGIWLIFSCAFKKRVTANVNPPLNYNYFYERKVLNAAWCREVAAEIPSQALGALSRFKQRPLQRWWHQKASSLKAKRGSQILSAPKKQHSSKGWSLKLLYHVLLLLMEITTTAMTIRNVCLIRNKSKVIYLYSL